MQIIKDMLDHRVRAKWWQLWSNQFALLAGIVGAWVVENQHIVVPWVEQVQQPYRSMLTFLVMAGIPIAIRMAPQMRLARKLAEQETPHES